ncbi:MAG: TIGR02221 family CRISPR-associated protein [Pelistega sp.]|nr:TIGR02221 family CRISPR-associated protein [Pelistega sp.]
MAIDSLISFLGKSVTGYRNATYHFDDGYQVSVPYFGLGLVQKIKPKRLILVGTPSSMWDVFFADQNNQDDALLSELFEASHSGTVDENLLSKCSDVLEEQLGCEVVSILIEFSKDEREQVALLAKLSEVIADNETLAIDVTHSFRHLPMLAMVASRFLEKTRNISTESIYYGALEMTDPITKLTPVIELNGLLKMLDWVDALASFEKSGDFSDFTSLYEREGLNQLAGLLEQASFYERTNQIAQARKPLQAFLAQEANASQSPIIDLFSPGIRKRVEWAQEAKISERQSSVAMYYLDKGDYLRAATLGYEAVLTKIIQQQPGNSDVQNYSVREKIKNQIRDKSIVLSPEELASLKNLSNTRNALAHGSRSTDGTIQKAMSTEKELRDFLAEALAQLNKI